MSRTIIALMGIIIAISFVSMASAQSISDGELFSAASQVMTATGDQASLPDQQDQLASVSESVAGVSAKIAASGAEVEGVEVEDTDTDVAEGVDVGDASGTEPEGAESVGVDGPGGSTHEFEGEEEGNN